MTRGPKKKSDAEKKTKGTYRPDRGQPELTGKPLAKLPPPDWLPDNAKEIWDTFRPQLEGMVTAAEIPMLEVYCCLQMDFRAGMEEGGTRMRSPEISQMLRMAAAFGLLPAERARVPKKQEPEKENPFKNM